MTLVAIPMATADRTTPTHTTPTGTAPAGTTSTPDPEATMETLQGERMLVLERIIVSPRSGVFRSLRAGMGGVDRGETIGHVHGTGTAVPVTSAFSGELQGMLAHEGERVREGQPIAWLRTA